MAEVKKIQKVDIFKLKPYENNAKIHTEEQLEKLSKSIEEFGFISPVLIDKDFNIIAGHGRVEVAGTKAWAGKISGYAQDSWAECVAEAVSDYYCNGSKAHANSKAIMAELRKYA